MSDYDHDIGLEADFYFDENPPYDYGSGQPRSFGGESINSMNGATHEEVCDGERVLRTNKKTGTVFWGCSNFPKCRWNAEVTE